jgi:fructokinase
MLAAILRENGVDDSAVVFDAGARTALAFVTLRADGEREFMFYRNPSADMLLTADELNVGLLKRVKTQSFLHTRVLFTPS